MILSQVPTGSRTVVAQPVTCSDDYDHDYHVSQTTEPLSDEFPWHY